MAGLGRLGEAGDGVMPLTFRWSTEMLAGESPYHDVGVAYPPLAMFLFALIGIGEESAAGYAARFVVVVLMVDFAGLCLALGAQSVGRRFAGPVYVLAVASAGPLLLLWRYDLIPAVCHLAAGLLLFRGLRAQSWAALGIGIAFKPYLAVVIPFWVAMELKTAAPAPGRRMASGLIACLVPSLVAGIAMLPFSGPDFASAYTFQASRGVQIESGPAVVLAELAKADLTSQRPRFAPACLCWERVGPAAASVATAFTVVGLAGLAYLVFAVWRRESTEAVLHSRVVMSSCAAILVALVTYRVFSPQYLLWALVPLSLVAGSAAGRTAAALVAGAGLAAMYLYPLHYDEVITHSGAGRWLLLARLAGLLLGLALLVPLESVPTGRHTPASG